MASGTCLAQRFSNSVAAFLASLRLLLLKMAESSLAKHFRKRAGEFVKHVAHEVDRAALRSASGRCVRTAAPMPL